MAYVISSGEISSGIILNSYDSMAVLDGGVASTTTVNQYGSMTVFSGGTAIDTSVDRGQLIVSSGGTVSITAVNSRGVTLVSSGGTANDTTVSGGTLGILEGGAASNVSVQAGGALYVDCDGRLTGLIALEKSAHVYPIRSGWKLDFDVSGVAPGPDAPPRVSDLSLIPLWNEIDFGITISGTQENGTYILANGAAGFDFTLTAVCADDAAFSGAISLQSGFVYGDSLYRLSVADDALCLTVSDVKDIVDNVAPTVANIQVSTTEQTYDPVVVTADFEDDLAVRSRLYKLGKDGAWLDYTDGVVVTENATVYLKAVDAAGNESEEASFEVANILPIPDGAVVGYVVSSRNLTVSADEFYLRTVVSGIVYDEDEPDAVRVDIVSGGTMVETSMQQGGLHISSGGVASKTEFVSRCGLTVSSGGTAADTDLTSGGSMRVDFGGIANDLRIVSSGHCMVSSGGTAAGVDVRDRGILEIFRGGTATNVSATPEHREDGRIIFGGILRIHVDSGTYAAGKVDGTGFEIRDGVASGCLVDSGHLTIYSGCKAVDTTVADAGVLQGCYIESGAIAERTAVTSRGRLTVSSGGTATDVDCAQYGLLELAVASNTYVNGTSNGSAFELKDGKLSDYTIGGGGVTVYSGCTATGIQVNPGTTLEVLSGGTATAVSANSGGKLELTVAPDMYFEGSSNGIAIEIRDGRLSGYAIEFGSVRVLSGGVIEKNAIYGLHFGECGISGGKALDTTVNAGGQFSIVSGVAENTTVEAGGNFEVMHKGIASNTVIRGADTVVSLGSGGKLTGQTTFAEETMNYVFVYSGAIVDFNIAEVAPEAAARINNLSVIPGSPVYTLTVSDTQTAGTYALAERAANFDSVITIQNTSDGSFGTMAVGETVRVGDVDYTLNLEDGLLSVAVTPGSQPATKAVPYTLVLKSAKETGQECMVEYTTDDFEHSFRFTVDSDRLSLFRLAEGNNAWRTMLESSSLWTTRSIENTTDAAPKLVTADADGNADVFFAYAVGTWEAAYAAKHVGSIGDGMWDGTKEQITLTGRNKIADVIEASTDSNILLMTDDANGDALFVDDIYTASPGNMAEQQARIAQIDEIRAGAGNDIVDMTSQRFEYIGDGLTIRGGEGNDTIWANKGDNWLFGDAGNDRIVGASGSDVIAGGTGDDSMHGGGGSDVFAFCDNWGADNVEQLADGSVTLWFAEGSKDNWDEATLTYTDGDNSVKVSGITADRVTLKFGDDGSDRFAALASAGAFLDATTEYIFEEESGKGILASL